MASRKLSYYLLCLTTIIVLTNGSMAQVQTSPYCSISTIPTLCNRVVSGAPNWREAMVRSINACTEIAYRIQNATNIILPKITGVEPQTKVSIQNTCKEAMDGAVSDLKEALKSLTNNDEGSMKSNLAALHTDCDDALKQFGIKFLPLNKVAGRYIKFMSVALAVAQAPR